MLFGTGRGLARDQAATRSTARHEQPITRPRAECRKVGVKQVAQGRRGRYISGGRLTPVLERPVLRYALAVTPPSTDSHGGAAEM